MQKFLLNDDVFGRKLFQFEMHYWTNDILYSMTQGPYNQATIGRTVQRLESDLLAHLRARAPDEIPAVPGFCIKDGFIADEGSKEQHEQARMQINFKAWPDVWVSISSLTIRKSAMQSLLQRVDSHPLPAADALKIKTLRRGTHAVNGRKAEEILQLLPNEEGIKQHSFMWEAAGEINNVFVPSLVLELESGTRAPDGSYPRPSLTDDQAIKLFDSIVNSIRLRPTGSPASTSQSEPPQMPLAGLPPLATSAHKLAVAMQRRR